MLEGNVEVRNKPALLFEQRQNIGIELVGMRIQEPDSEIPLDAAYPFKKIYQVLSDISTP